MDTFSLSIISTDKEKTINLLNTLLRSLTFNEILNINVFDLNNDKSLEVQFIENIHKYDKENYLYFQSKDKDNISIYNKALNKSQGKYVYILKDDEIKSISIKGLTSLFESNEVLITPIIKSENDFPQKLKNFYNWFPEDVNYQPSLYLRNTCIKHVGHFRYKEYINKNSVLSLQAYIIRVYIGKGVFDIDYFRYKALEIMDEEKGIELKPVIYLILSLIFTNVIPFILVFKNEELFTYVKFEKTLINGITCEESNEKIVKEIKQEQGFYKELVNGFFFGQIYSDYIQR